MRSALIIIDYVNDFVDEKGALTVGEPAQKIDRNIETLIKIYEELGGFIVVASDIHFENEGYSPEKDMFPPHCISETWGRKLYGKTGEAIEKVSPKSLLLIDKKRYSAFTATPLDLMLRERGVDRVILAGVCTDICVLHTAVEAYNLGYKGTVHADTVASFNQSGHEFALSHFKNTLGFNVINNSEK